MGEGGKVDGKEGVEVEAESVEEGMEGAWILPLSLSG